MHYNYLEAMVEDIKEWMKYNHFDISEYTDLEEAQEYLHDTLWDEDDITGNGAMGYAARADYENFLCHNWDALIEAIADFYVNMNDIITILETKDITFILRWCDSLIRLNTLDMAIATALDVWVNKEQPKEDV